MTVIMLNRSEVLRAGVGAILKDQHPVFGVSSVEAAVAVFDKSKKGEAAFMSEVVGFHDPIERLSKLAPVIVFSFDPRPDSIARAIAAGAVAYLHVSCSASILRSTVDAVFAVGEYSVRTSRAINSVIEDYKKVLDVVASLSATEVLILRGLARGMSNTEISKETGSAYQTVRNAIPSLISKLGFDNRLQVILWAHDHGFGIPLEEVGYED